MALSPLAWASDPPESAPDNGCRTYARLKPSSEAFTPGDFPPSAFRNQTSPKYAEWAAETANDVARKYAQGVPMRDILADLRDSRRKLAREMSEKEPDAFGRTRIGLAETPVGPPSELGAFAKPEVREWVKRIEREEMLSGVKEGRPIEYRTLHYLTRDGTSVAAGRVFRFTDRPGAPWTIEHPDTPQAKIILDDAIARFDDLRTTGKVTDQDRVAYFTRACAGWYLAMPWDRGSAGAGVPLTSGIASALGGKGKPHLPPDLDILFMTSSSRDSALGVARDRIKPGEALPGFPAPGPYGEVPFVPARRPPVRKGGVQFDDFGLVGSPFFSASFHQDGELHGSTLVHVQGKRLELVGFDKDRSSDADKVASGLVLGILEKYHPEEVTVGAEHAALRRALQSSGFREEPVDQGKVRMVKAKQ